MNKSFHDQIKIYICVQYYEHSRIKFINLHATLYGGLRYELTVVTAMTSAQPTFTCSKLTTETLEHVEKYVQSQQKRQQNDAIGVVL